MSDESYLISADFNPQVCLYWLLSGALALTISIVGIPLLLLWLPLGFVFTKQYLDRMECLLTEKSLKVKKGILVRVEKTIPLEKITDMGLVQGPIMRHFDLHTLIVETAGQSGPGALVSLTGITDAKAFRERVLEQRDRHSTPASSTEVLSHESSNTPSLLAEIRDSLRRIETLLESKTDR